MIPENRIEMPANAFRFFLESIPNREPLLQPLHTVDGGNAAEEYVAAREFWRKKGWVEMDFDGLVLTETMQQIAYPLRRCKSLLRWEHDGVWECFVRGPVCLLWVVQEETRVTLTLLSGGFALERLRSELLAGPRGMLTVLRTADGESASAVLDGLSPKEDAFNDQMERQMQLFYREAQNA